MPLAFVENRGQFDSEARFYARSGGRTIWFTTAGPVFDLGVAELDTKVATAAPGPGFPGNTPSIHHRSAVFQRFENANPLPMIEGVEPLSGSYNYFLGDNPTLWQTNVRSFREVVYRNVWPGIDVRVYGNGDFVEQEFLLQPGARADSVNVSFVGADALSLDSDGSLVICVGAAEFRESPPRIFQRIEGRPVEVGGRFVRTGPLSYSFALDSYDRKYALVIDPAIIYSSYLGGSDGPSNSDQGLAVAVDGLGGAVVTGVAYCTDFPSTPGAYQTDAAGLPDTFVTRYNPAGSAIVYSTYVGGSNNDIPSGIALGTSGDAYVAGNTDSADFPTTPGAYQPGACSSSGACGFVAKLSEDGTSLDYSTYLGGVGTQINGIAVTHAGKALVTGTTADIAFPTTPGAFQEAFPLPAQYSAFITRFSADGSLLEASTFLGATMAPAGNNAQTSGTGITVGHAGEAFVTGYTVSTNFPTTPGSFQDSPPDVGFFNAIVSRLSGDLTSLVYSTYLGGTNGEIATGLDVDDAGQAYVVGTTNSLDFPVTAGSFQTTIPGANAFFVTKLNAAGSALVYSTFLSGPQGAGDGRLAVDAEGQVLVSGSTADPLFPLQYPIQPKPGGGYDAVLAKLRADGSDLEFSTFLGGAGYDYGGGIALDPNGNAYLTGRTQSPNFPVVNPVQPELRRPTGNAYVAKLDCSTDSILKISTVSPNMGGDGGIVTAFIRGSGFNQGAAPKLVATGQADISGTSVFVSPDGFTLRATFDLRNQPYGPRDVVVMNPDLSSATMPGAFAIETGRFPQPWAEIYGNRSLGAGRRTTYYLIVGNRGNVDAHMVPVWVEGFPLTTVVEPRFELITPPDLGVQIDWSQVPAIAETQSGKLLPLIIPLIPAGQTAALRIDLTDFSFNALMHLRVRTYPPLIAPDSAGTGTSLSPSVVWKKNDLTCQVKMAELAAGLFGSLPGVGCATAVAFAVKDWTEVTVEAAYAAPQTWDKHVISTSQLELDMASFLIECGGAVVAPGLDLLVSGVSNLLSLHAALDACLQDDPAADEGFEIQVVSANDPNDKVGPLGAGPAGYRDANGAFGYLIHFENLASATAPAQEVFVTDQLDPSHFDLATFGLGPIAFGDQLVVPDPGLKSFSTDVDLRPNVDLLVRINAHLDPISGMVSWSLRSIDPETGELPADPLVGFLPPNIEPPEGDGSVVFSVRPKEGLLTGTELQNEATIIFDLNEPIETPAWLNTLDVDKPTSQVAPLPASQAGASFTVNWDGVDVGSGIRDFSIQVSEDGGPTVPWLPDIAATSGIFVGRPGSSYAFSSRARDFVWNIEDEHAAPDAITQISPAASVEEVAAQAIRVDPDGDDVLSPGETVVVQPSWKSVLSVPVFLTGTASSFAGPPGGTYTIVHGTADYGMLEAGSTSDCWRYGAGECYSVSVDVPPSRPDVHWDTTLTETPGSGDTPKEWILHIGGSFGDTLSTHAFYRHAETLFHNGITGGCGGANYCPTNSVTRSQMAVFLLKSKHGSAYIPPNCTGVFDDVVCPGQFADWIEQLAAEGITGGCGGENYCPGNPVTRQQMAVFLLKAKHGSSYLPPPCEGAFGDVACPSQFADWIEELANEFITGGCGNGNYCPTNPNTRGQMAVFLTKTFGLQLYTP